MVVRKWMLLAALAAGLISALDGCGNGGHGADALYPVTVVFMGDSTMVDLADLPAVSAGGRQAVCVQDLVDTALVTEPGNYVYRFSGSDGARAPDHAWSQLAKQHAIVPGMTVTSDPNLASESSVVEGLACLEILRKIDFVVNDSVVQCVVADRRTESLKGQDAVRMTSFLPDSLAARERSSYQLVATDGYIWTMPWEIFNQAYYVIPLDEVHLFEDLPTVPIVWNLMEVIVIP